MAGAPHPRHRLRALRRGHRQSLAGAGQGDGRARRRAITRSGASCSPCSTRPPARSCAPRSTPRGWPPSFTWASPPGARASSLERVAVNVMDYRIPDARGEVRRDEPCVADGPAAYASTLPLRAILDELTADGIPAHLSYTAGTYLCNYTLYTTLHALALRAPRDPRRLHPPPALARHGRGSRARGAEHGSERHGARPRDRPPSHHVVLRVQSRHVRPAHPSPLHLGRLPRDGRGRGSEGRRPGRAHRGGDRRHDADRLSPRRRRRCVEPLARDGLRHPRHRAGPGTGSPGRSLGAAAGSARARADGTTSIGASRRRRTTCCC